VRIDSLGLFRYLPLSTNRFFVILELIRVSLQCSPHDVSVTLKPDRITRLNSQSNLKREILTLYSFYKTKTKNIWTRVFFSFLQLILK